MARQQIFECVVALTALSISSSQATSGILKEIALNEFQPQAILNLPSKYTLRNGSLCDYWVTFLRDVPVHQKPDLMDYGISVKALDLDLQTEDTLEILANTITNETHNIGKAVEKEAWDSGSGKKLEYTRQYHDLCINLVGYWTWSKAKLLITLYFNNTKLYEGFCPDGMSHCKCPSSSNDLKRRCIATDLLCNGQENCGLGCDFDESEDAFCNNVGERTTVREFCVWSDFEYLLMMVMTGLLLILVPAIFLLTMFYHRRISQQRITFSGASHSRECPHVITISPDQPPKYDDLPEELKVPYHSRTQQNS